MQSIKVISVLALGAISVAASPEVIVLSPQNADDVISHLRFPELRNSSRPFTFFVEGIVGAGKSTLLESFKKYDFMDIIPEPVDIWTNFSGNNMLKLIYEDPSRWGAAQEMLVQRTMMDEHMRNLGLVKGMERSIHSARFTFMETLRPKISNAEYFITDQWYRLLTTEFDASGDLISEMNHNKTNWSPSH